MSLINHVIAVRSNRELYRADAMVSNLHDRPAYVEIATVSFNDILMNTVAIIHQRNHTDH
ncbi:hypothetical protein ACPPVU_10380 [Mucilaginibacter sp. McL0603]|uniref:hypothetical protein n=1 Tax=Mucilaginibacter sp. McL0603 TaxID=3415670 RepID=UPI003CE9C755